MNSDPGPARPRDRRRLTRRIGWLAPLAAGAALAGAATASAAPQAHVEAGAFGTDILTTSVFGAQSFRLRNDGDVPIVKLTIDLGDTSLFPDIVFDPSIGDAAGDSTTKSFTVDVYEDLMDPGDPNDNAPLASPPTGSNSGANGNGFNVLAVDFPGEAPMPPNSELKFSIDVDPTSIQGSNAGTDPTATNSAYPGGAISGAELHGAKITIEYAGGDTQTADLTRIDDNTATTDLPSPMAPLPTVALASGVAAPVATPNAAQNIAVTGPPNQQGVLLVAEGNLYLGDTFAGVDLDPFEANVAVKYTEYPFTFDANGDATVGVTLTNTPITDLDAALFAPRETGLNYITAWVPGAGSQNGPVSDPLLVQLDPAAPPPVPPPGPGPNPLPAPGPGLINVGDGPLGLANCASIDAPAASGPKGSVVLSAAQLRINQRIGQAAIRRLNAIQKWLDDGIVGRDLCGGTLGPRELGAGLAQAPGAPPIPATAEPRPLDVASAAGDGTITLTPGQLRINQRIYRAALLRARALEKRMSGALTGGDLVDDTLEIGRFAVPIARSATAAAAPAASVTDTVSLTDKGTPIILSAGQLRTNQRIAQQAVREANALRAIVQRGLTGTNFAAGSVTTADVS